MTSNEHKKHAELVRPQGGKFHRQEVAILGAPCSIIQNLTRHLAVELQTELKLGYVDADHGEGGEAGPFSKVYTDKISHHQVEFSQENITYSFRRLFEAEDALLINGNHFVADRQIVIINRKKEESLSRKLDRLTNVMAILLDSDMEEPFPFLQEALPNLKDIPILPLDATKDIAQLLLKSFSTPPPIKGLVFAGGRSVRMGRDKGAIDYHGKPQREYMADLLSKYCDETFLSVRELESVESQYPLLPDTFMELGPFGGLLSAFRSDPNSAWLAVACDVPFVDDRAIGNLIEQRDPSKVATCYHNEVTNFPEPMITLWEPRAYDAMLQFLAIGYSCPRKVLINSDINELAPYSQEVLTNVNTPEEYLAAQERIQ